MLNLFALLFLQIYSIIPGEKGYFAWYWAFHKRTTEKIKFYGSLIFRYLLCVSNIFVPLTYSLNC